MPLNDAIKARVVCYTPSQISVNVTYWYCTAVVGGAIPNEHIGFNLLFKDRKSVV